MSITIKRKFNQKLLVLVTLAAFAFIFTIAPLITKAAATAPSTPTQLHTKDISVAAGSTASAINTAISTVSSAGGGTVTLASGTYTITEPIVLKSNITLTGAGKTKTILQRDSSIDFGLNVSVITVDNGGLNNVIVKNLTVDANNATDTPTLSDLSWHNGAFYITDGTSGSNDTILLDSISVINGTFGLHIKGTSNLTIQNSNFDTNGISIPYGYGHNIYLRRVSNALVTNCYMTNAASANGLNISYSDNIAVTGCYVYGNNFRGIRAADSSYIDILNNYVHDNGTDGIILNSEKTEVTDFRIISNTVANNGRYGIYVTSACSTGEVTSNVDGGGNVTAFLKIDGSNITQ